MIDHPSVLRPPALFLLGAQCSAQELSYNKMLGQLQDSGNAATIAHYLELLSQAGILTGLQKYNPKELKRRASSPRLMVHDTSLMTASLARRRSTLEDDPEMRGHVIESAVGAYLMARGVTEGFAVNWWRGGSREVDFVIENGENVVAIEVKSGRTKSLGGMNAFLRIYPEAHRMVIGGGAAGACSLDDFLSGDVPLPWE